MYYPNKFYKQLILYMFFYTNVLCAENPINSAQTLVNTMTTVTGKYESTGVDKDESTFNRLKEPCLPVQRHSSSSSANTEKFSTVNMHDVLAIGLNDLCKECNITSIDSKFNSIAQDLNKMQKLSEQLTDVQNNIQLQKSESVQLDDQDNKVDFKSSEHKSSEDMIKLDEDIVPLKMSQFNSEVTQIAQPVEINKFSKHKLQRVKKKKKYYLGEIHKVDINDGGIEQPKMPNLQVEESVPFLNDAGSIKSPFSVQNVGLVRLQDLKIAFAKQRAPEIHSSSQDLSSSILSSSFSSKELQNPTPVQQNQGQQIQSSTQLPIIQQMSRLKQAQRHFVNSPRVCYQKAQEPFSQLQNIRILDHTSSSDIDYFLDPDAVQKMLMQGLIVRKEEAHPVVVKRDDHKDSLRKVSSFSSSKSNENKYARQCFFQHPTIKSKNNSQKKDLQALASFVEQKYQTQSVTNFNLHAGAKKGK